jgi:hypothetical protein
MQQFYAETGNELASIAKNEQATEMWVQKLNSSARGDDVLPLRWASWMLKRSPNERPTAQQILGHIKDTKSNYVFLCSHCFAGTTGQEQRQEPAIQSESLAQPSETIGEGNLIQTYLDRFNLVEANHDPDPIRFITNDRENHGDKTIAVAPKAPRPGEMKNAGHNIPSACGGADAGPPDEDDCVVPQVKTQGPGAIEGDGTGKRRPQVQGIGSASTNEDIWSANDLQQRSSNWEGQEPSTT